MVMSWCSSLKAESAAALPCQTPPAGSESRPRQSLAGRPWSRRSPAATKGRAAQLWDCGSCRPRAPLRRPQGDPLRSQTTGTGHLLIPSCSSEAGMMNAPVMGTG